MRKIETSAVCTECSRLYITRTDWLDEQKTEIETNVKVFPGGCAQCGSMRFIITTVIHAEGVR